MTWEINLKNAKKNLWGSLPICRDHLSVKSGQIGLLEKVIVWEKAFSSILYKWRQTLLKRRQRVLIPRVAWKACLEPPCGKQSIKTVIVCNISNHEVINAIHPKFCIGIFNRCLALFNIFRRKNRYTEERRGLPQNSFIPVAEKRYYFLSEDLIYAVKQSRIYFVTWIKFLWQGYVHKDVSSWHFSSYQYWNISDRAFTERHSSNAGSTQHLVAFMVFICLHYLANWFFCIAKVMNRFDI